MKFSHRLIVAIAILSLAACQREAEAPMTAPVEPAATMAPVDTPMIAPTEPAATGRVTEQAAMDFAYRCRQSNGAWSESTQACEITPMLCPTFGTWVDAAGCKSEVAQADCVTEGQQFVEGQGCLIRSIPAAAMREADFNKD